MNCPVCIKKTLQNSRIESELPVSCCDTCGGIWIKEASYWKWLKFHGDILPEKPETETAKLPLSETPGIRICPSCKHFMTKRKVGHGLAFHVDRCASCGGIWLDKNEWEVLKSRNLHDEIHLIFSTAWQKEILSKENEDIYRELDEKSNKLRVSKKEFYESRACKMLGNDYEKVRDFNEWLDQHPLRWFILAYLKDENSRNAED